MVTGLDRPAKRLSTASGPVVWVGVNYWSSSGGPRMWRHYDRAVVRDELGMLAERGLGITRSFCFWPDFMPTPTSLDKEITERFADFLDAHMEAGLKTIPTFLVGHMSGQNWDPSWRQGRDLYSDVWFVSKQCWFVAQMARRFSAHPAVDAWLLTNEVPIYGGQASQETIQAWAELMVQALRSGGATQPVSIGDGAWGMEVTGHDNGYSLRALASLVDFVGPHTYPAADDPVRQNLKAAFACELAAVAGHPVIMEEFGVTSNFTSEVNAAHYYRQLLHTSMLAGARGWLAWNNCDFDNLSVDEPYSHHPFEMHFGLIDSSGRPKAQMDELSNFALLVSRIDLAHCGRPPAETALVVPAHVETAVPFSADAERRDALASLEQAHVALREADLAPRFMHERDGLDATCRLYLLPCAKILRASTPPLLETLARGGAVVYASYFSGTTEFQRGPWWGPEPLFGVRHLLRYGLVDPLGEAAVAGALPLQFVQDFGPIAEGTVLDFTCPTELARLGMLPVEPAGAEVVALDARGRPALVRRQVGSGHVVLATYPLELLAASSPGANPEPTWALYDALAAIAGVAKSVAVANPTVMVDSVAHESGHHYVVFVSQAAQTMTVKPELAHGRLITLDGDEAGELLSLPPYGVAVMELVR